MEYLIMKGLFEKWWYVFDEFYDWLCGFVENLYVLVYVYLDVEIGGIGENEFVLFMIDYGEGCVFYIVMGDNVW